MGKYRRTYVWLELAQHQALNEISQHENRSLSEVVREMVAAGLRQRIYSEMAAAAELLNKDYRVGGELTDMTVLDSEEFLLIKEVTPKERGPA